MPRKFTRRQDIDLALAVLDAITPPGHFWSRDDMADICGCSKGLIENIENEAKKKLARNPKMQSFANSNIEHPPSFFDNSIQYMR